MNLLLKELKIFSKNSWGVYAVFFICLFIIWYTERWSIFEVSLIFIAHFLWDLLMMMMWAYYAEKKYKEWAITQALWNFVFLFIWFYAILKSAEWQYFLPTFAFIMWAIKTYFLQVKSKNISFLNGYTVLFLNTIVFFIYLHFNLFWSLYSYIQFLGFTVWAIGLIIQNPKERYIYYVWWTSLIAIWSFMWIYANYIDWNILGTSVSYFLLPFTVVIYYLKNIKKHLY